MDKLVTSGQFNNNTRTVKGVEEQKRQTITVSSNLVYFRVVNKTVSTIVLDQPLNNIVDAQCLKPIEFLAPSASNHIVVS
jgi:hypothetical protein